MKVAVVLSGHMRCWQQVFPNFNEMILDKYQPDVFIHTWSNEGYWSGHFEKGESPEKGVHQSSPVLDVNAVKIKYNPIAIVVEELDNLLPMFVQRAKNFPNYHARPQNAVSMFYKMGAAMQLLDTHVMRTGTKYDLVIRMRPDLVLHTALPDCPSPFFRTLWHRNHLGQGTGDMLHMGQYNDVAAFSRIGTALESLYEEQGVLCAHELSVRYIQRLGLQWQEVRMPKHLQHTPKGEYQSVS